MKPVVRFAPSPTGALHIGSVRTALFNYLFARKNGGTFLLRIEDTDLKRSEDVYTQQIYDSLSWLDLKYDEQVIKQSSRTSRYKTVINQLLDSGLAYRCFSSEEELSKMREDEGLFLYPRIWRDRSKEDIDKRLENKDPFTIRLKIPLDGVLEFVDLIYGKIKTNYSELDDFIIARSDGSPTYNFTVVVDDHDMQISHVIRGEDHIANTPKQLLIYSALQWSTPEFAHLPMILGHDGKRLSKRHGAKGVPAYRESGYLPYTLINYLSLLGWNPGNHDEVFDLEYLIKNFSLEKVNKKAAIFDNKKLDWISGQHIKTQESKELLGLINSIEPAWGQGKEFDEGYLIRVITELKPRAKTIRDLIDQSQYFFSDPLEYNASALEKCWDESSSDILKSFYEKKLIDLDWSEPLIEDSVNTFVNDENINKGKIIQLLRVSFTGSLTGPSITELMIILGRDICLRRINNILDKV